MGRIRPGILRAIVHVLVGTLVLAAAASVGWAVFTLGQWSGVALCRMVVLQTLQEREAR